MAQATPLSAAEPALAAEGNADAEEAAQRLLAERLKQAAAGEEQAWRDLVHGYSVRVYGLLVRQCGDRELAEELTQATFVRVFRRLADYQELGRFEPWLFRIATNLLRDELRRRQRQATPVSAGGENHRSDRTGGETHPEMAQLASPQQGPLEQLEKAEQLQRLREMVDQMSEADREILHLRHTAGLSFPQIAETLEQPLGTVLARAHRALGKLRKMMGRADPAEA